MDKILKKHPYLRGFLQGLGSLGMHHGAIKTTKRRQKPLSAITVVSPNSVSRSWKKALDAMGQ